ncbi:MAG: VOC family protein [Pseudomonas sp.]
MSSKPSSVHQLRLVVESDDYDAALHFYRDVLGMAEQAAFQGEGNARVAILDAGRATLEIANSAQKRMIDRVEADGAESPRLRVALQVNDAALITEAARKAGARVIATPRLTPWGSLNARLDAPATLQITLFQEA